MSKWGQSLKFFKKETNNTFQKSILGVENYVFNQLRIRSPVDTGAYRSNHNRTLNSPNFNFDESKTYSSAPQPVPTEQFFNMYVSNGAPYATKIEDGHSEQAPSGVYALAYDSAKKKYGL